MNTNKYTHTYIYIQIIHIYIILIIPYVYSIYTVIFPAIPWHFSPRHQNAPSGRPTSRRPARCARSEATWGCSIQLRDPRDQAPRHSSWGWRKPIGT